MVTHSTTTIFLYNQPEGGRITGRNMVNILCIKIHNKIEVYLLVVYIVYKFINLLVRSRNYNTYTNIENYGNKCKYGHVNNQSSRMNIGFEVKGHIFPILTNPEFSQHIFVNETKHETTKIRPPWAELSQIGGRTDKTKVTVAFRKSANAPKNSAFRPEASLCVLFDSHNTQPPFFLHNTRRFIFLIQTCCVLWEVKTEPSCTRIRQINISLQNTNLRIIT
jgi:hypothetical protein